MARFGGKIDNASQPTISRRGGFKGSRDPFSLPSPSVPPSFRTLAPIQRTTLERAREMRNFLRAAFFLILLAILSSAARSDLVISKLDRKIIGVEPAETSVISGENPGYMPSILDVTLLDEVVKISGDAKAINKALLQVSYCFQGKTTFGKRTTWCVALPRVSERDL